MKTKMNTPVYTVIRGAVLSRLLQQIKSERAAGAFAQLLVGVSLPYFILYYLGVRFFGLFAVQWGRMAMTTFLKAYFEWYFWCRGVTGYLTRPAPLYEGKGFLVLSVRQDPMASVLFHHLLPYPIIVPVHPDMYRFPLSIFFPWRIIGRSLRVTSYSDYGLDSDLETIKALLDVGYPVLVYINTGYMSPLDMSTAYLYGRLTTVLQWDVPIYVSTMEGMHMCPAATKAKPMTIRCNMLPLSELLAGSKSATRTDKINKILEFLGFSEHRFVSKPFE